MKIGNNILGAPMIQSRMQLTTTALNRALTRLSSGQRVSSPRDDVAGFAVGQRLQAQVRGLTQEVRNNQDEIYVTAKSESNLTSQLDLVQRMREIAVQASNENITADERSNLSSELQGLLNEFNRTSSDSASISKSVGNGNFQGRLTAVALPGTAVQTKLADLNQDGKLDLILSSTTRANEISVYLGAGNGSFNPRTTVVGATLGVSTMDVGDINEDGQEDLLIEDASGTFNVLLGNGEGSFQALQTYGGAIAGGTKLADVDADGHLDAVFTKLGVVLYTSGNGDGTFDLTESTILSGTIGSIVSFEFADFNLDGREDIAFVDFDGGSSNIVGVSLNSGGGSFGAATTRVVSGLGIAGEVTIAQLNGDEVPDVAVNVPSDNIISTYIGDRTNLLGSEQTLVGVQINDLAFGDINGDGITDLVGLANSVNQTGYALGNGNGSFQTLRILSNQRSTYEVLHLEDLDGDGIKDIFINEVLYRGLGKEVSALPDVDISTADKSKALIQILDTTLDKINTQIGELSALHSKLDMKSAAQALMAETLDQARSSIVDADVAVETAEVLRLQILQEAQTAVYAQGNLSLQMVLKLIG